MSGPRAEPWSGPRIIAVDGPSGSGKTVFAESLMARLRSEGRSVALVPTDDFATWERPAAWWPELEEGVLGPLAEGRPGGYRRVEWVFPEGQGSVARPTTGALVTVPVREVLVLEGVTSARRAVTSRLAEAYWVQYGDEEADGERVRLERAVARDGEACREHLRRWQAFERGWFAVDDTRSRCVAVRA